ncbi:hypothetical protein Tco_1469164, partial [Tanacetum coccineum]
MISLSSLLPILFLLNTTAYGGEPTVELFRGFFNLYPSGKWLTLPRDQIKMSPVSYPSECLKLLSKDNRHPVNVRTFSDPILFLAGLKSSWEHGQQRPLVENTANSGGSSAREKMLMIGTGSIVGRMQDREYRTKGSTKPLVKPTDYHLMISNVAPLAWRGHLDNQLDAELLDLHDRCYAKQSVVDNVVNQRACELLRVVDQIKGECDVLKERDKARGKECEDLKAKCKAGYQENLMTLESKFAALEVEKGKLEVVKATL